MSWSYSREFAQDDGIPVIFLGVAQDFFIRAQMLLAFALELRRGAC